MLASGFDKRCAGAGLKALALLFAMTATASSQQTKLTPRELFYDAAPPSADSVAQRTTPDLAPNVRVAERAAALRPAIRYGLMQRQADGQFRGVDPAASVFHSGDQVRVFLEANQPGYLYIVQKGSSGRWSVLFPAAQIDGGKNRVPAFETHEVPAQPGPGFTFDIHGGEENLYLAFTLRPTDPDSIFAMIDRPTEKKASAAEIAQLNPGSRKSGPGAPEAMQSRDLILEKIEEDSSRSFQGTAIYAASSETRSDCALVVHLRLVHQ